MKLEVFDRGVHGSDQVVGKTYHFWCPGCEQSHTFTVRTDDGRPNWSFDGNMERPTFTPSLLYPEKNPRCHLFLRSGRLEFLADCGHSLAGKTVELPDIPDEYLWGQAKGGTA